MKNQEGSIATTEALKRHGIVKAPLAKRAFRAMRGGVDDVSVARDTLHEEPLVDGMSDDELDQYRQDVLKARTGRFMSGVTREVLRRRHTRAIDETRIRNGEDPEAVQKARQEAEQFEREA